MKPTKPEPISLSGKSKKPHETAYCRCGGVWRTNTVIKTVKIDGLDSLELISDDPCPKCFSSHNIRKVSNDLEGFST